MIRVGVTVVLLAWLVPAVAQPPDAGSAGVLQKLRKLSSTASLLHTTAHPDDEHGGMLAMMSRGRGARVGLLTLTRGEAGDNAIGPELFDALGLIRVEELALADRYYGVDRQYFTTAVDYGFSKRLDEALEKWGRDDVLREVVRVIREDRPFVLVARFQGNARDGHGNHQAAGLITREAFAAAGDPARFPEQIAAGLRPWQPLKLYMGGVRATEDWTLPIDTGAYDPVMGESYANVARLGLSFQRSQNGGRYVPQAGPSILYYKRLDSRVAAPAQETSFFDGIDVTLPGLFRTLGTPPPPGAEDALVAIARHVRSAEAGFSPTDPSAVVPALTRALAATRGVLARIADPDAAFVLRVKERQMQDAIAAALGLVFTARAQPADAAAAAGPFAAPIVMAPVVPGQTFGVRAELTNRSAIALHNVRVALEGQGDWQIRGDAGPAIAAENVPVSTIMTATVPRDARFTRPAFTRRSIQEARYTIRHEAGQDADGNDALTAVASFEIDGTRIEVRQPVTRLEPNLPYGYETRVLAVVPAIAVTLTPPRIVVPRATSAATLTVQAEVVGNVNGAEGTVRIEAPSGWRVEPASQRFRFARAGERAAFPFTITIPAVADRDDQIAAVATFGGREFREGYDVLQHRDLETRYLYREAVASVRGVDVAIAPGLTVGYVMGIGDDVPSGLTQLGVTVQRLGAADLATGDLSRFNAIITETRAYAVRDDLVTYNRRLLDYVKEGGNLIVLYNTQEFVPSQHAPYPGSLPPDAEEVSEEDAPVDILAPADPVFTTPNHISAADFDGWVEQRGSKFWAAWDAAYTPLVATHDRGQAAQRGGWLHARYGKGHYTYFAYALHRQLPYGVPGAYRLLANLLSLR